METIEGVTVTALDKKQDNRGFLIEFLRLPEIPEAQRQGQFYCTVSAPGVVRGNHYHSRKTEWFCILGGEALLLLIDRKTGAKQEVRMSGEAPATVRIPPDVTHALKNVGNAPLFHVAYISEAFKEADPDTIREVILE